MSSGTGRKKCRDVVGPAEFGLGDWRDFRIDPPRVDEGEAG
jgi:hypothetical protein